MPTSSTGNKPDTLAVPQAARPRKRLAFTLVELMVVVAIIAVLSGMAIPQFFGRSQAVALRQSTRELLDAARYAQHLAVTQRRNFRLVIDPREGRFEIQGQDDPERQPDSYGKLKYGVIRSGRLPEGVRFGDIRIDSGEGTTAADWDEQFITFTPTGGADAAIIQIGNEKTVYSLLISSTTGRAQLVRGAEDQLPNDRLDLDA